MLHLQSQHGADCLLLQGTLLFASQRKLNATLLELSGKPLITLLLLFIQFLKLRFMSTYSTMKTYIITT